MRMIVAPLSDGRLQMFVLDNKDRIWSCWEMTTDEHSNWTEWASHASPVCFHQLTAVSLYDKSVQLFALNADTGLIWSCKKETSDANAAWTSWIIDCNKKTSPVCFQWIYATACADGRIQLFAIDKKDGHLWRTKQEANYSYANWSPWIQHKSLLSEAFKEVIVAPLSDGRSQLFALDKKNQVWSCWETTTDEHSNWAEWTKNWSNYNFPFAYCKLFISSLSDKRLRLFALDEQSGQTWTCEKETSDSNAPWTAWKNSFENTSILRSNEIFGTLTTNGLRLFLFNEEKNYIFNFQQKINDSNLDWIIMKQINTLDLNICSGSGTAKLQQRYQEVESNPRSASKSAAAATAASSLAPLASAVKGASSPPALSSLQQQGVSIMSSEQRYIDQGNHFLNVNKDYKSAIAYYRKAIEINRFNAATYESMANAYAWLSTIQDGDSNRARAAEMFGYAYILAPERAELMALKDKWELKTDFNSGIAMYRSDVARRLSDYKEFMAGRKPGYSANSQQTISNDIYDHYWNLAQYYFWAKRYSDVIEQYENCDKWLPKTSGKKTSSFWVQEYVYRGIAYVKLGRFENAKLYLDKLLTQAIFRSDGAPNDSVSNFVILIYTAFIERGKICQKEGDDKGAIDNFQRAIKCLELSGSKYPDGVNHLDPEPYLLIQQIQQKLNRLVEEAKILFIQGVKNYQFEDYAECLRLCNSAISLSDISEPISLYIMMCNFMLGHNNNAFSCISVLVDKNNLPNYAIKSKIQEIAGLHDAFSNNIKKRDFTKSFYQNWLRDIPNNIGNDIINIILQGRDHSDRTLSLPAITKNGKLSKKSVKQLCDLIATIVGGKYKFTDNFSEDHYDILLFQIAKGIRCYFEPPSSAKSTKKEQKIKLNIKDIPKNISLKTSIESSMHTASALIESGNKEKTGRLREINDYENAVDVSYNAIKIAYQELDKLIKAHLLSCLESSQQIIERKPEDKFDYVLRADAYLALGKYQEAISDYQMALRLNCKIARVYTALGDSFAAMGIFSEALTTYQKALDCGNNSDVLFIKLGNVYVRVDNWKEAINAYSTAIKINSSAIDAHKGLGKAYYELGDNQAAIEHCNIVIASNPKDAELLFIRAKALKNVGNLLQARSDCLEVLRLSPHLNNQATMLLQEIDLKIKQQEPAKPAFSLQETSIVQAQKPTTLLVEQESRSGSFNSVTAAAKIPIDDKPKLLKKQLEQLKKQSESADADLSQLDDDFRQMEPLAVEFKNADYYVIRADFYVLAASKVTDKDQAIQLYSDAIINYGLAIKFKPLYKGIGDKKKHCETKLDQLSKPPSDNAPARASASPAFFQPAKEDGTMVPESLSRDQLTPDMAARLEEIKERMRQKAASPQ